MFLVVIYLELMWGDVGDLREGKTGKGEFFFRRKEKMEREENSGNFLKLLVFLRVGCEEICFYGGRSRSGGGQTGLLFIKVCLTY